MILDSGIETKSAIERSTKVQRFLDHAKTFSFDLPSDYQFDREELYDLRLLNPFL